jgi:tRNA splicing ligase
MTDQTRDQITDLENRISEIKGDAGRYWQECEFTQRQIKLIRQEIARLRGEPQTEPYNARNMFNPKVHVSE